VLNHFQVMQITQKTEDEVVIALHDNALDIALTIDALLEGPQVCLSQKFKSLMLYFPK